MANKPTMDAAEAEQLLGPRGALKVTTENRGLVRRWLTARGLASSYVGTLSLRDLETLYNQTDDSSLNAHRQTSQTTPENEKFDREYSNKDDAARATPEDSALVPPDSLSQESSSSQSQSSMKKQIAEALAKAVPAIVDAVESSKGPSKAEIQKMLADATAEAAAKAAKETAEAIADSLPVKRIEIQTQDGKRELPEGLYHKQFEEALRVVSAGVPLCLVGPAGSGKTTVSEQIAAALGMGFNMLGAVSGAHEFLGFIDGTGRYQSTPFRHAFENGTLFLADEIDASDAAGLLVINSALANGCMPFPDQCDKPVPKHAGFRMIAAANTFGRGADRLYVGRNQLDAATLDRFYFLSWEYDEDLERIAAGGKLKPTKKDKPATPVTMEADAWIDRVQKIRAAVVAERARMVVSPRASIYGTKLLANGLSVAQCEAGLIWKGVDDDLKRRVMARVGG